MREGGIMRRKWTAVIAMVWVAAAGWGCSEAKFKRPQQTAPASVSVEEPEPPGASEPPPVSPAVREVEGELVLIVQGETGSAKVSCPDRFFLEQGECWSSNEHLHVRESRRLDEKTWYCKAENTDPGENGSREHIRALATCISP